MLFLFLRCCFFCDASCATVLIAVPLYEKSTTVFSIAPWFKPALSTISAPGWQPHLLLELSIVTTSVCMVMYGVLIQVPPPPSPFEVPLLLLYYNYYYWCGIICLSNPTNQPFKSIFVSFINRQSSMCQVRDLNVCGSRVALCAALQQYYL